MAQKWLTMKQQEKGFKRCMSNVTWNKGKLDEMRLKVFACADQV